SELQGAFQMPRYVRDVQESKALDMSPMPKIIVSASGMATGGRVLHHLKHYAPDPRSTILFAGYQAAGTRGAAMVAGADKVKIHGEYIPVRAEVQNLPMLSAHADSDEILRWLGGFEAAPSRCFRITAKCRRPTRCVCASRTSWVGRCRWSNIWRNSRCHDCTGQTLCRRQLHGAAACATPTHPHRS